MVGIYRFVAISLVAATLAVAAPVENGAQKRALLPNLLGNVKLSVSACPDVGVNTTIEGCSAQPGSGKSIIVPAFPTATAIVPAATTAPTATAKAPGYNNGQPPAVPAPSVPVPAPAPVPISSAVKPRPRPNPRPNPKFTLPTSKPNATPTPTTVTIPSAIAPVTSSPGALVPAYPTTVLPISVTNTQVPSVPTAAPSVPVPAPAPIASTSCAK
ncbi:hypothetical protein LPJ66_004465 [Kickxella alabastrina]|uniref:Uncharacterized protein n=1 Tax=Kickxella alabastrina TaxID=61397 RepID=A0ACC1INQ8_9FUNG|nr:hypothetical protein LPJ66_004465 [Kickxella alabastrina]